ncbi:hypothetical protein JW964_05265 [candidate division KSB1 bacterium]|nr:hypothetical protein [candidate division KSB1 bacterium]
MRKIWMIVFWISSLILMLYQPSFADITINAAAPARKIKLRNFYGGYSHNEFYAEQSVAYRKIHQMMKNSAHKRQLVKYWRTLNLLSYRNDPNDPDKLVYYSEKKAGHPYDTKRYSSTGGFNFTRLDQVFDEIVNNANLIPMVEFCHMPHCMALDPNAVGSFSEAIISPPKDYNEWSHVVKTITQHFISRYGTAETRKWYWGIWNEPNHLQFWDFHKYGYDGFIKLFDYGTTPMRELDNQLLIGGPDNTAVMTYSKQFVTHTKSGKNYYNGQTGSPASYFSTHAYSTNPRYICREAWKMAKDVVEIYGETEAAKKKIFITECAPDWNMFGVPFTQDRFAAIWLLTMADIFLEVADINGELYLPESILYCGDIRPFGLRSIMAYPDDYENWNSDQILKTPIFNIYEMLSYLSDERLPVEGCDFPAGCLDVNDSRDFSLKQVRCLATRTGNQSIELLVYHFDQKDRLTYNKIDDGASPSKPFGTFKTLTPATHSANLKVTNIPFQNAKYRKFVLDQHHSEVCAYHYLNNRTTNYTTLDAHDDLEKVTEKDIVISNGQFTENLSIQTNSATLIIIESTGPAPHLSIPTNLLKYSNNLDELILPINNDGTASLTWSAAKNPEATWLSLVAPTGGTLNQSSTTNLTVRVNRTGLKDGFYQGKITITSNGGNQEIIVTMQVGEASSLSEIRINAGGGDYTATNGLPWIADRLYEGGGLGYVGGATYATTDAINNTLDDPIYQSERNDMQAYRFEVPNGVYQVKLHLAEIYFELSNKRVMSVLIEGQNKLSNLDIFQQAGHDAALVYTYSDIIVEDGRLDIEFSASINKPKISGIEITKINSGDSPPSAPINIRVVIP